jgi:hypothetical protein
MAVTITWVKARQIFDSRGNPTVEVRSFLLSLPGGCEFGDLFRFAASLCRCAPVLFSNLD